MCAPGRGGFKGGASPIGLREQVVQEDTLSRDATNQSSVSERG